MYIKLTRKFTLSLFSILVISLFLGSSSNQASAQSDNLVNNPSFEGPFSSYIPPTPIDECRHGECTTAQLPVGWSPWWVTQTDSDEAWENRMPEYKPAEAPYANRIHSGEKALQYFTFHSTHTAGFFQTIDVPNNAELEFKIWGQAWSDTDDTGVSGFPTVMNMKIGIDPTGGTDAFSGNIVWSGTKDPYDSYQEFSITARAQGSRVTIFTYSRPEEARKHNDVYWDTASLIATNAAPPTSTPWPTHTPGPVLPTNTPGPVIPTNTPLPTRTPWPTNTPLPVGVWPTATLDPSIIIPPTNTPVPPPVVQEAVVAPVQQSETIVQQPIQVQQPAQVAAVFSPPTSTPDAEGVIYSIVGTGDSIWSIAAKAGISLDEILQLNNMNQNDFVSVGQRLKVGTSAPSAAAPSQATSEDSQAVAEAQPTVPPPTPVVVQQVAQAQTGGEICLAAFDDSNRDSTQNAGENFRSAIAFTIYNGASVVSNYVSDGISEPYCIPGLSAGTYTVTRSKSNSEVLTTADEHTVTLADGGKLSLSFGSYIDESIVQNTLASATDVNAGTATTVTEQPTPSGGNNLVLFAVLGIAGLLLLGIIVVMLSLRRQK